eukprot:TRINITY_DN98920_c0_g1_i1.p1 TRINITY_DN98920_c0_g1~~TRINITY_DN98920_c0_g1_i1.p1  ORF type:complete len:374 (-),score=94.95 TRINITY_DN98920_c0_g1_i1:45-1130(-)
MGRKHANTAARHAKLSGSSLNVEKVSAHATAPPPKSLKTDNVAFSLKSTRSASCPEVAWLRLGTAEALSSGCCARLSWTSRAMHVATKEVVAERIALAIHGSCLSADLRHDAEPDSLLTLSHLESMAHSPFLFAAVRGLLRAVWDRQGSEATSWLLESSAGPDALCDVLLARVFLPPEAPDDAERNPSEVHASLSARLAALLYHYRAPEQWASSLHALLAAAQASTRQSGKRRQASNQKAELAAITAKGGELAQLLQGLPELLPATRAAVSLAEGKLDMVRLLCQLVERLAFPPRSARLALQVSLPLAHESKADLEGQTEAFLRNLDALEQEARVAEHGPVTVWVLEAGDRQYVLLLEGQA